MRNIVLTGLPGSGKTSLGRMAAERLGLRFIDLDELIESRAGLPVSRIFSGYGEDFFRELEAYAAREAAGYEGAACEGAVIATGGGAVLRGENMRVLGENGLVVFIDRPPEIIARGIDGSARPLLRGGTERLFELDSQRRPLYLACADAVLKNTGELEEALSALLAVARSEYLPDGYAVIGDPVSHSLSPRIHGEAFGLLGVPGSYEAIHVPHGKLEEFITKTRGSGLMGFNVTMPHKCDIIPLLDEVDEDARLCGAVNTVTVRGGRLCGYNTDMDGLSAALRGRGRELNGSRVTILGAGGAAAGAAFKSAREGALAIKVLARSGESAAALARRVSDAFCVQAASGVMSREALTEAAAETDILINCTPLGMSGGTEDFADLDFLKALPPGALVCDLIYNPPKTSLLREAERLGLETQNGLDMLIYQALIADELFFDIKTDKEKVFPGIISALARENPGNLK